MQKRVIGIDPGIGLLGFGIIDHSPRSRKLVDGGVIRTPIGQPDSHRLKMIFDELTAIVIEFKPQIMIVEKLYFAQNVTTAMSVSQARGVVLLVAEQHGLELIEMTPLQIKQSLTGYGKADKKQIQEMVRVLLGLEKVPQPDDCADALAAALSYLPTQSIAIP